MEENQSATDKPFDPTPKKLEDARRKGEIVRSTDLNTGLSYAGFLLGSAILAPWAAQKMGMMMQSSFARAETLASALLAPGGQGPIVGLLSGTLLSVAAIIAVPAGLLLAGLVAQRGLLITPTKLAPKLSRISPFSNAKQKFGPQGLFQFLKSSVKLVIVSAVLAFFLWLRLEEILASLYTTPSQVMITLGQLSLEFLLIVTLTSFVIGGLDWMWEWAQLQNRNRMSRQEMVDETKTTEGDPQFKQLRRQKGQAIAMNQMMSDVPNADVIVVNPTHYAVALKWDRSGGGVPICVAKGVDAVAHRIREVAMEAAVPIFSDPPTARAIHASIEIGEPIERDHYRAVAAAIRFADMMRGKTKGLRT